MDAHKPGYGFLEGDALATMKFESYYILHRVTQTKVVSTKIQHNYSYLLYK